MIRLICAFLALPGTGHQEPAQAPETIEVLVTPASVKILEMDPVLLKVTVENKGERPFGYERTLSHSTAGVAFELRRPGESNFAFILTAYTGTQADAGFSKGNEPELAPMGRLVCYELLSHYLPRTIEIDAKLGPHYAKERPIFLKAGTYEIRARVHIARIGKMKVLSKPVKIEVAERKPEEREMLKDAGHIADIINTIAHKGKNHKEVAQIQQKLGKSDLKFWLRTIQAIWSVRDAKETAEQDRALGELTQLRKEATPVAAEYVDLLIARQLLDLKRWPEAEKVLARFPHSGGEIDMLKYVLKRKGNVDR